MYTFSLCFSLNYKVRVVMAVSSPAAENRPPLNVMNSLLLLATYGVIVCFPKVRILLAGAAFIGEIDLCLDDNMRKSTTQHRIKGTANYNDGLFSEHKVSMSCCCFFFFKSLSCTQCFTRLHIHLFYVLTCLSLTY